MAIGINPADYPDYRTAHAAAIELVAPTAEKLRAKLAEAGVKPESESVRRSAVSYQLTDKSFDRIKVSVERPTSRRDTFQVLIKLIGAGNLDRYGYRNDKNFRPNAKGEYAWGKIVEAVQRVVKDNERLNKAMAERRQTRERHLAALAQLQSDHGSLMEHIACSAPKRTSEADSNAADKVFTLQGLTAEEADAALTAIAALRAKPATEPTACPECSGHGELGAESGRGGLDENGTTCTGCDGEGVVREADRKYTKLEQALQIAEVAHKGQLDKAGKPYMDHVRRVVELATDGDDADVPVVAALHDVVEDSNWGLDDLAGFGPRVVAGIDAVTRRDDETYSEFIARAAKNELGRAVKLLDVTDHLQHMTPEAESLRGRYVKALETLARSASKPASAFWSIEEGRFTLTLGDSHGERISVESFAPDEQDAARAALLRSGALHGCHTHTGSAIDFPGDNGSDLTAEQARQWVEALYPGC